MKANFFNSYFCLPIFALFVLFCAPITLAAGNVIGISDNDLAKITIGLVNFGLQDSDHDGLDDELERAIGTDPLRADTDNDGYIDYQELAHGYDPTQKGVALKFNQKLTAKLTGSELLRVQHKGELWYLNPTDHARYLVNSKSRRNIIFAKLFSTPKIARPIIATTTATKPPTNIFDQFAEAIRNNDKAKALALVNQDYQKRVAYTLDYQNDEQRLTWANMFSATRLKKQTDTTMIYTNEVYTDMFDQKITNTYKVTKQADGRWLISQL